MIFRLLHNLYMKWKFQSLTGPLTKAAQNPLAAQQQALMKILRENRETEFGKAHYFAAIRNIAQYRRAVDVQEYHSLKQMMDLHGTRGGFLTNEKTIMFAQTSGTTGRSKYIPVSDGAMMRMQKEQALATAWLYRKCPQGFRGKALGIVSAAVEGETENGIPVGSASGHIYQSMPKSIRHRYVVPSEVFSIDDYDLKYRVIARLAIQESDITYLGTANPSTLIRLMEVINGNLEGLIAEIETGSMAEIERLPEKLQSVVKRELKQNRKMAVRLRDKMHNGALTYRDIWPNISLVMTWTGGSCGVALKALRKGLPEHAIVVDPGYIATECRGTLPCDEQQGGLPLVNSHFYEFVERREWEMGEPVFRTLAELQAGVEYYLLITTRNGLYRYFMNDIVTVAGIFEATPMLRFMQKGSGVVNITGEKLSESHLLGVMHQMESKHAFLLRYFLCLGHEEERRYRLYIESDEEKLLAREELEEKIDSALREANLEYDQKRASGRLRPVALYQLEAGTGEKIKCHYMQQGRRENQFKPPILMMSSDCSYPVEQNLIQ